MILSFTSTMTHTLLKSKSKNKSFDVFFLLTFVHTRLILGVLISFIWPM